MQERILEHSEMLVNKEIDDQIKTAQQALAKPAGFDGVNCIEEECGEPIPQERLSLGAYRCIDCQEAHEQKEKLSKWHKKYTSD
jgi:RNA polymerase-binding transcription factor DksA